MKKLFYPAVFHRAEEGGFWVSFPDLPECLTQGDDMTQAYEMAVDALGLCLVSKEQNKEPFPQPSEPDKVSVDDGFLAVVEFDMAAYKKRTNPRAVKRTISLPGWLDEEATAKGVNFSQALQEALIEKLRV